MIELTDQEQMELLLVFAVILLLIAAGNLVYAMRVIMRARRSRRWPEAAGTVLGHAFGSARFNIGKFYIPRVQYTFEVDGRSFRNDEIRFGGYAPWGRDQAQAILDQYPIGGEVQVVYDPDRPQVCALMRKAAAMMSLTYGITTLIVGLLFLMIWTFPTE